MTLLIRAIALLLMFGSLAGIAWIFTGTTAGDGLVGNANAVGGVFGGLSLALLRCKFSGRAEPGWGRRQIA